MKTSKILCIKDADVNNYGQIFTTVRNDGAILTLTNTTVGGKPSTYSENCIVAMNRDTFIEIMGKSGLNKDRDAVLAAQKDFSEKIFNGQSAKPRWMLIYDKYFSAVENGEIKQTELAEIYGVSTMTIHRDINKCRNKNKENKQL